MEHLSTWESVLKDALLEADKQLKLYQKEMINKFEKRNPILWEIPRLVQKTDIKKLLKEYDIDNITIIGTEQEIKKINKYI